MSEPLLIATIQKNGSEELRVSLDHFRGHDLLDIRVFAAFTAANVPMPTKKGLSIRVDLIPELREALEAAEAKARELGLLE
jgi:hypothetical protein